MNCFSCGKENPPMSRFCQYCGAPMSAPAAAPAKTEPMAPIAPPTTQSTPPMPVQAHSASSMVADGYRSNQATITQLGAAGTTAFNIWGPFVGYGERGRHVSWLLDGLGNKAEALHEAVTERFQRREIPNARMNWVTLIGKGIIVEKRPFYLIRRGIATAALYIGRFGEDLYISQVTYAKGPINNLRAIILGAMILFQLYFMFGYTSSLANQFNQFGMFGSGPDMSTLAFLLCVVGPLGMVNGFLLFLAFVYSAYKWLRDRDFLAVLRMPPNEFQLDDITALEKAVEETVRQSLDKIGIAIELMPPADERSFSSRRLI